MSREPVRYLSTGAMARRLGTTRLALGMQLQRYRGHARHPSPVEDAITDMDGKTVNGWLPGREAELREWLASLPGTGRKGEPKPASQRARMSEAAAASWAARSGKGKDEGDGN